MTSVEALNGQSRCVKRQKYLHSNFSLYLPRGERDKDQVHTEQQRLISSVLY